jgi:phytoene synthase
MFAVYAWCREVDDIADGDLAPDEKLRRLADCRTDIDRLFRRPLPSTPTDGLGETIERYGLDRQWFEAVLQGMEWDARAPVVAPRQAELETYCRCVAGAVGRLSLPIFGCDDEAAREFAFMLGDALQLTNILRDLREDGLRGRLYLPAEALESAGVPLDRPNPTLEHPRFPTACDGVADWAERRFAGALSLARATDHRKLWPALAMLATYRRLLDRLRRRGWRHLDAEPRFSTPEMLWLAASWRFGWAHP